MKTLNIILFTIILVVFFGCNKEVGVEKSTDTKDVVVQSEEVSQPAEQQNQEENVVKQEQKTDDKADVKKEAKIDENKAQKDEVKQCEGDSCNQPKPENEQEQPK